MFSVAVLPTKTLTVDSAALKPIADTVVLYSPGTRAPELKTPEEFVVTIVCRPVARFLIVISAPVITAAEGSVTVPKMLPVPTVVWAKSRRFALTIARRATATTAGPILAMRVMGILGWQAYAAEQIVVSRVGAERLKAGVSVDKYH